MGKRDRKDRGGREREMNREGEERQKGSRGKEREMNREWGRQTARAERSVCRGRGEIEQGS